MDFDLSEEQRLLKDSVDGLLNDSYDFEQRKKYGAEKVGWSKAVWGKLAEQGQFSVFLTRNGKPYVARPGDVLDGQYRVDAIDPPVLELTYLPLAQKQTLNIGTTR